MVIFPRALRLGGHADIGASRFTHRHHARGKRRATIGAGTAPSVRRARDGRDEENGLTQENRCAANRSTLRHAEQSEGSPFLAPP